jgi:HprK-related kinase A
MLEWGMNWCVSSHAHSYLIIHAAVVEKDGNAAILPAPPGSGKSTLCAALVCRGWRLLSDELALVSVNDGQVIPLPRPVSLKNASIDIIQQYEPDATLSRPVTDTMKGTVAHMKVPTDSIARAMRPANAAWVIFPQYQPGADPMLVPLPQSRAFIRMADNAFNYSTLGVKAFETLAKTIDTSQCYEFTYSRLDDAIETFNNLRPRVTSL